MKQQFSNPETQSRYQSLLADLNNLRDNQKPISAFSSVIDWVKHGQEVAVKKAGILAQMEEIGKELN